MSELIVFILGAGKNHALVQEWRGFIFSVYLKFIFKEFIFQNYATIFFLHFILKERTTINFANGT